MNFLNLTIRNLGVFRGQHHFDFIPVQPLHTANGEENIVQPIASTKAIER